jgi:hypothetical protein
MMRLLSLFLLSTVLGITLAFTAPSATSTRSSLAVLEMAPKYDKATQKWSPTKPEEGPGAGYGVTRTLLRHGPKPFLQRVFTPDDYEQAVLKFMAGDKCSRDEAQGNMDAYLENPNDWAYNRMYSEKTGIKVDYVSLKTEELVKTLVWSGIVAFFVSRVFVEFSGTGGFWDFLKL